MANPLLTARQILDGAITAAKLAVGAALANLVDNTVPIAKLSAVQWTTFTPTLTQVVTLTPTVNWARYQVIGKTAFVRIHMTAGSTGTVGGRVEIGNIPAAIAPMDASASGFSLIGLATIYDASANQFYTGVNVAGYSSSTFSLIYTNPAGNWFGNNPAITVAINDHFSLDLCYEIA